MNIQLEQLEAFQKAFKSTYSKIPCTLSEGDWKLRYDLSKEELEEYKDACEEQDIVEIFDAILDRLFLAFGDAVSHGLQDYLVAGFNEVLASNMSKLNDEGEPLLNGVNTEFDSTRPFGKVMKSKNFFKPRLKEVLGNNGRI